MLADWGVSVRYKSASVKGLYRRAGEIVEENGIQVVLATPSVRVGAGTLGDVRVDDDINVDGTIYLITDPGSADSEGFQRVLFIPKGG